MLPCPPSHRDNFEEVDILGASQVGLPLTPRALLVMQRAGSTVSAKRIDSERFEDVNRTTAAQCFEFVVGTPTQERRLSGLDLAPRRPSLRFNVGPGIQANPDGSVVPLGDVVHSGIPSPQPRIQGSPPNGGRSIDRHRVGQR